MNASAADLATTTRPLSLTAPLSLARGIPSVDLLGAKRIADAAREAVLADAELALSYGDPRGHPALRRWFGAQLDVPEDRILLTNGSLQALAFLTSQLAGPRDWVAVERPTYDASLRRLTETGARIIGIEMESDGLDVNHLERLICKFGPPAFCYTIPTFHNPTGTSLSNAKRHDLVNLSQHHGLRIVEDDPYGRLRFSGASQPSLLSLDPDRVIHLTSLSKVVAPGLRCGAVVLPLELVEPTVQAASRTYIAPGQFAQATAAAVVNDVTYENGLTMMVDELRKRRDALLSGLRDMDLECDRPAGGYFAWPHTGGIDAMRLSRAAREAGVTVVPGRDFYLDGGGADRVRLTWAALSEEQIEEGLKRLSSALTTVRGSTRPRRRRYVNPRPKETS